MGRIFVRLYFRQAKENPHEEGYLFSAGAGNICNVSAVSKISEIRYGRIQSPCLVQYQLVAYTSNAQLLRVGGDRSRYLTLRLIQ